MKTLSSLIVLALCASVRADGLSLSEAEALALSKNPLIPAAAARVEAARARARLLTARYAPQVNANAYYGRGEGATVFSGPIDRPPKEGIAAGNVTLEWRLFTFGQSDSAHSQGEADVRAAEIDLLMTKLDVLHELRIEFAGGLRIQDEVEGLKAQVEAALELERITNERYEAGKVPQAYVFRAKADRLRAERDLVKAEAELQGALAAVAVCCGADITDGRLGGWDVPMWTPNSYEEAMSLALQSAPELALISIKARSLLFSAQAAERSSLPQISLFAMGDTLSRTFDGSRSGSQMGLLLSIPLFDGGSRRAEAAEARAQKLALASELAAARNKVRSEVVTHWSQWAASEKVVESGQAELDAASEGFRIAKIRYEEGKSIQAEVSQALADLQVARAARTESLEYKRLAWAHLVRAIGVSQENP